MTKVNPTKEYWMIFCSIWQFKVFNLKYKITKFNSKLFLFHSNCNNVIWLKVLVDVWVLRYLNYKHWFTLFPIVVWLINYHSENDQTSQYSTSLLNSWLNIVRRTVFDSMRGMKISRPKHVAWVLKFHNLKVMK